MYTSSDLSKKVLNPASRIALILCARLVFLSSSTIFILYGSAQERLVILVAMIFILEKG
jgi:hypothetical protein